MATSVTRDVNDQFIRTAFERCPAGLVVVDSHGRLVVVNQELERLLGYDREELLGQPIETLVPGRFSREHVVHRRSYLANPTARPMGAGRELYARHRDGHEVPVEVGLSTIEIGDEVFVLATVVDVTERRLLEERLRHTHKLEAIGNLASGIALISTTFCPECSGMPSSYERRFSATRR